MKMIRYLTLIVMIVTFVSGCNSIKRTLRGDADKNFDEFLVKKKNPLVLPPNYDDLPKPQKENVNTKDKGVDVDIDLSDLLNSTKIERKTVVTKEGSLEKSISNIINKN
jgi:hypothetical protein